MSEPEADPALEADAALETGAAPDAGAAIPLALPPFPVHAMRPRLSPLQIRRIDRLSRRAHRFHHFAHHPLCGRYAGEVIRIGKRIRVCRGCSFAVLGGLAGGALAVAASFTGATSTSSPAPPVVALIAATLLFIPSAVSRRRIPKLISRLAPAALFAFAITTSVLTWHLVLAALSIAAVVALRVLYGRRGGDRSPCETCPERHDAPCSGFAPIVRREQAFQRAIRRFTA